MMLVELTAVPSAVLPIADFADHLHIGTGFADDGSQNAVLEAYLRAAIAAIEARIGKSLVTRSFSWQLTAWRTAAEQGLPVAPVQTITAVNMADRAGTVTVIDPASYYLVRDSQRPKIAAVSGVLAAIAAGGHVDIEFDAGFGATWTDVPVDLAQAVFLLAAHYYANRRTEGGRRDLMPFGVMALIETYRSIRVLGGGV